MTTAPHVCAFPLCTTEVLESSTGLLTGGVRVTLPGGQSFVLCNGHVDWTRERAGEARAAAASRIRTYLKKKAPSVFDAIVALRELHELSEARDAR